MQQRFVAAWRRLFARPHLSPAMETFLGRLAETPYQWSIDSDGKIRGREQDAEVCVITGVARDRTGVTFSVGDWVRAAEMIGLSYTEAGLIVAAADSLEPSGTRINLLRKQLLVAAHIQSSPATPPATPDAMDRALADLFATADRPAQEEAAGVSPLVPV